MADESLTEDRYPSGRRKAPLGVRQGGAAWARVHEQLARSALNVMAQRGYDEMSVDHVSAESGVSKRTIYRHFGRKVELAVAAIQQLPKWDDLNVPEGPMRNQVRQFIEITSQDEGAFAPVLATALVNRNTTPELLQALRESVLEPRERAFARYISLGQERGELDPNIQPAAVAALSTGMQVDHLTGLHPWDSTEDGVDYAFNIIWPMIRSHSSD